MTTQPLPTILGQPSWQIASDTTQAWLTQAGGHLGPIRFHLAGKTIEPMSVAPWAEEHVADDTPQILKSLRGDFFCMPFGGNAKPFRNEKHPVHGETANSNWQLENYSQHAGDTMLHCSLETKIRPGRVDKHIILRHGETTIYQKHIISNMSGPMNLGHHAMLKFPDEGGLVSTSRTKLRQVWLEPTENPESRGYSALKPGALFSNLEKVPTIFGTTTDLSRFPARRGFEDIAININHSRDALGWTAVVFPKQRYAWFALKDPQVLAATLFWISNGGRHYAPWNGRHTCVMGIEDLTSFFHAGLAESAAKNPLNKRGIKTTLQLNPKKPLIINYIFGVAPIPAGFDHVKAIQPRSGTVELLSRNGKKTTAKCDAAFLQSGA